jgi:hypothetical protein
MLILPQEADADSAPGSGRVSSVEATPGTLEPDSEAVADSAPGSGRVSSAEATPRTLETDLGVKADAPLVVGA